MLINFSKTYNRKLNYNPLRSAGLTKFSKSFHNKIKSKLIHQFSFKAS
jgi:hypothetical protein